MKKVLLIEDDVSISELQRDYLEINGYQVDIAQDGELGLQMSLSAAYDLILLDLMLPKLNGFEVCRKIREKMNVPILMVSSRREDIDLIRGLGLGADDYITKPFKPAELVARVKAHIARYERLVGTAETKNDIRIRGLHIDPDTRKVFVNETEVVLTTKEFDLLYFLAKHPDRVFSKDHLFEKIWGIDAMGDVQTVTVHIRKIREKIERDSANPAYIETVWGTGYRCRG
ncbi:DNA-binding response OmpR family regulator [Paenibacillus cellulosilyticus]|uniref:DNA-binding response OmpR family regulator n=1 Tax=Paenibacillus cellulosilyticus TaxID=375489 RepID=A0A2V2YUX6_9BACL|nr:response regulator transcription factor [Paenibacillus cellulosilyticus]PWW04777.1 DNA-binding response OmpR family regulator [Paenibacillus cellulosilyticus]QKS45900.1 response regulator transcription factor [Paenibacillus cellulosilyticus]